MTYYQSISTSISRLIVSLLLLFGWQAIQAQKVFVIEKDSIPMFRGFQVTFDLIGPAELAIGDYGHYEGAFRLNLHDQWFPVVEVGYGKAESKDEATEVFYKTAAPYYRVGIDFNILKNKHAENRLYAGVRYAFTSFKADVERLGIIDPTWGSKSDYRLMGVQCSQHWLEAVFGVDTKIYGPFHLGWYVRYKRRLIQKSGDLEHAWYVPGFGINNDDRIGVSFNAVIDI